MMFIHHSHMPPELWRWGNFSFKGDPFLACPCCGEFYLDEHSMDMLQATRKDFARPLRLNSCHRCWHRNVLVGGAPRSEHKLVAFDIVIGSYDRFELLDALKRAGFTTFGLYQTFIHTDRRPNRKWYGGKKARELWT